MRAGDDIRLVDLPVHAAMNSEFFSRAISRYGVAKRDMLNAFAGENTTVPNGNTDNGNLGIAVNHFTDTAVL
jgi:hypothetical protein